MKNIMSHYQRSERRVRCGNSWVGGLRGQALAVPVMPNRLASDVGMSVCEMLFRVQWKMRKALRDAERSALYCFVKVASAAEAQTSSHYLSAYL